MRAVAAHRKKNYCRVEVLTNNVVKNFWALNIKRNIIIYFYVPSSACVGYTVHENNFRYVKMSRFMNDRSEYNFTAACYMRAIYHVYKFGLSFSYAQQAVLYSYRGSLH